MMAVAHFVSDRISWTAAPNEPTVTFRGSPSLGFQRRPRSSQIVRKPTPRPGEAVVVEGHGLMARCIQPEVDHLNGRLFIDRIAGEVRKQAMHHLRQLSASSEIESRAVGTALAFIATIPAEWVTEEAFIRSPQEAPSWLRRWPQGPLCGSCPLR